MSNRRIPVRPLSGRAEARLRAIVRNLSRPLRRDSVADLWRVLLLSKYRNELRRWVRAGKPRPRRETP